MSTLVAWRTATWETSFRAPAARIERLRLTLLWLMAFSGAFVFIEPGPYEVVAVLTITLFALTGLTLPRGLGPLLLMLLLCDAGFALAVLQVIDRPKTVSWVFISWYLSATALFVAAALAVNTQARLARLADGWVAAALVASLVAILAYFHLFGAASETFLKFGRARGTFNDPNVLGAFLVCPGLLLLQRMLGGSVRDLLVSGAGLLLVVAALLLSFSRGAWGQFAAAAATLMLLGFVLSRSNHERLRIVLIGLTGLALLVAFLALLLSIDAVGDLFTTRASLTQDYDVSPLGRFERYALGFELALERPFGIGPLQFATLFPEDPHNTFLNAFMTGGWIVGVIYPTLVLSTMVCGFRGLCIATPWRPVYLAVFCAFVGTVVEGAIIDVDHWRHLFLLLGLVWGLALASRQYGTDRAEYAAVQRAG